MTPTQLLAEVAKGKFRPAYYFYGTEDYRIIEAEKFLARQFLPDLQLTTNFRRVDGRKASFAEISAELSSYPMLGERLVVAVSDIQKFTNDEFERLGKLLLPADPNRLVIFSTPSARVPRKDSAFLKKIVKLAEDVEFKKLTTEEAQNTIVRSLGKANLKIEMQALRLFAEAVGGNRGAIENETEKLAAYKEAGSTVSLEDVRSMVSGFQVFEVYSLAEEILKRDAAKVLKQIQSLVADGNTPTGILFFVSKHFIDLYLVKNGKPLESRRRWLAYKYRDQAAKFDNDRLAKMILSLADADVQMRKGRIRPELCLEMLAVELMQS
jgi:DNA polymerase III subunit delta